jgi:hypothetical protein
MDPAVCLHMGAVVKTECAASIKKRFSLKIFVGKYSFLPRTILYNKL